MNALVFEDIGRIGYTPVDDPTLQSPTDVILKLSLAGLCGSDLHVYHGRETGIDPGTVLGHEYLGQVVEAGEAVKTFRPGDDVLGPFTTNCGHCHYCRIGLTARCSHGQLFGWVEQGHGLQGVQAEYARVPLADATLCLVPSSLDPTVALLAGDILSTALFAVSRADVSPGDLVAILGCGPVGLLAVLVARDFGAEVIAIDLVPERLEVARAFGAQPVPLRGQEPIRVVRARSDGRGADRVIDAVGSSEATALAAELVRPGAVIAAVGVHTEPALAISPGRLYDLNLTYVAGRCPARALLPDALAFAQRHADRIRSLITHRLPLSEGPDAYRMFSERRDGCVKVLFEP